MPQVIVVLEESVGMAHDSPNLIECKIMAIIKFNSTFIVVPLPYSHMPNGKAD